MSMFKRLSNGRKHLAFLNLLLFIPSPYAEGSFLSISFVQLNEYNIDFL